VTALNYLEDKEDTPTDGDFRFRDLLERPVLRPFLIILVLMVLLQLSGQGAVTAYTAHIFKVMLCFSKWFWSHLLGFLVSPELNFSVRPPRLPQTAGSALPPPTCALLVGLAYLASALLSLLLRNLVGRRVLLLASQLGMALSHLGLGLYFHKLAPRGQLVGGSSNSTLLPQVGEKEEGEDMPLLLAWLPLLLVITFTVAFNLGLGSLTWVIATEVLPVRSRGWTHTIANLTSNLCWFLVTKTFQDLQDSLGHAAPFFFYGGVCLFGLVFIFFFLPETRGRTPEETAQNFAPVRPILDMVERSDGPKSENKTTQNTIKELK
jgi:hypothetical protein